MVQVVGCPSFLATRNQKDSTPISSRLLNECRDANPLFEGGDFGEVGRYAACRSRVAREVTPI